MYGCVEHLRDMDSPGIILIVERVSGMSVDILLLESHLMLNNHLCWRNFTSAIKYILELLCCVFLMLLEVQFGEDVCENNCKTSNLNLINKFCICV